MSPGLKRSLSLFDATVYGIGIILGAGIYALIGQAAGMTGNSVWISFIIGALVASFTGLSYAELATMMPRAAAEYVYLKKSGSKLIGFLIGWLIMFTGVASAATVALGFAGYFNGLFGLPVIISAIALIVILSYISFLGIKESSRLNVIFTGIEVIGLAIVIILGVIAFGKTNINYLEMSNGSKGILAAAALVFFAYIGFEDIANMAEETKNPKKVLYKAFILAVTITTLLYVLTSIAAVTLATPSELSQSKSPLALAASKTFLGGSAFTVLSYIALFATANTVLVIMIVSARMLYGMSKSGALPKKLGRVHANKRTPYIAIALVMLASIVFVFFGEIAVVANITSLGAFIIFGLVNGALIWLRYKYPNMKRPFKTPINIGRFPVLAFLGLITSGLMVFQFSYEIVFYTGMAVVAGVVVYLLIEKRILR